MRYQTASDLKAELKRLKRDTESGRSTITSTAVIAAAGTHRVAPSSEMAGIRSG